jgi:hypothetical protein
VSIFDPAAAAALLETVHKGTIDTQWHTVPEGEYIIQCKELTLRQVVFKKIEGTGVGLDIQWEVIDDTVKRSMNIDHPTVRQSMLIDLVDGRNQLDFSTNRNQSLKNVIEACNLNTGKFSLNMLKNQTCFGRIKHRPDDNDPEIIYAEVARVTSLEKARARQQRQADAA